LRPSPPSSTLFPYTTLFRSGDPAVLQRDLAVLDHLEGDLVLDLFDTEAGGGLVLDDEAVHLVVGDVACPDDRDVAPRRITDPPRSEEHTSELQSRFDIVCRL